MRIFSNFVQRDWSSAVELQNALVEEHVFPHALTRQTVAEVAFAVYKDSADSDIGLQLMQSNDSVGDFVAVASVPDHILGITAGMELLSIDGVDARAAVVVS